MNPQLADCVIPAITEGSWSRQDCKRGEKELLRDWSAKNFASTFWRMKIFPEISPAQERLAGVYPINEVFQKTAWLVIITIPPEVGEKALGCSSRLLTLPRKVIPTQPKSSLDTWKRKRLEEEGYGEHMGRTHGAKHLCCIRSQGPRLMRGQYDYKRRWEDSRRCICCPYTWPWLIYLEK